MVNISILNINGVYKLTYNWGAPPCTCGMKKIYQQNLQFEMISSTISGICGNRHQNMWLCLKMAPAKLAIQGNMKITSGNTI
jgi:hypothetical protein